MAKRIRPTPIQSEQVLKDFVAATVQKYPTAGYSFAAGYLISTVQRLLEDVPAATAQRVIENMQDYIAEKNVNF